MVRINTGKNWSTGRYRTPANHFTLCFEWTTVFVPLKQGDLS